MTNGQKTVQQLVDSHYTNEDGMIHAYPHDRTSEYLSESVGLYMQYLLEADDPSTFKKQVALLESHFLVEKAGMAFIPWRLYEGANVNALIDDLRIAAMLKKGSVQFREPNYAALADRILRALKKQQHKETLVDYYDWSYGLAGNRLTLSYLIKELTVYTNAFNMLNVETGNLFFPEYYDFTEQQYKENEEVHMIDQLLIAINRFDQGLSSPRFNDWLLNEWKEEKLLYGRYDRMSGVERVDYESLAVYYYVWQYFMKIGHVTYAQQAVGRAGQVAREEGVPGEMHFFDFIHYNLMMAGQ